MSETIYLYNDKPVFGMDIGFSSIKVMQLSSIHNQFYVKGYGVATFEESSIVNGVIDNYESIASSVHNMFSSSLTGTIDTKRVIMSIPASYTFSRIINLPSDIAEKDIPDAVNTEIQQYLPSSSSDLYLDYSVLGSQKDQNRILTVATQRKLVDSYMNLARILGLEVVAMEPTTSASNRLFGFTDQHKVPTVLIDFGAISTDVTIYDNDLVVTGTTTGGGDHYTDAIRNALDITSLEAETIKSRYGLNFSKKQTEIIEALKPLTDEITKEIKRMVRYYEERINNGEKTIGQVVLLGGGANIPGLSDYFTNTLRLPVRTYDPWNTITFESINLPKPGEENIYITSAGLALMDPKEPFA